MRIMLCQTHIQWEDKQANINALHKLLSLAKEEHADLLCLPEMSFTGFSMNIRKTVDDADETRSQMVTMARTYQTAIAFGYVTPADDKRAYNHYAFVDSAGEVLGDYIKIHPFSYSGEDMYFSRGNQLVYFDFMDFKIGLALCYDLRFAEQFIALGDVCDLILLGAAWPAKRSLHWRVLSQARAIENQCYMAVVNCYGSINDVVYSGNSMLVRPDGVIMGEQTTEGYAVYTVDNDVSTYRSRFPVRQDRITLSSDSGIVFLSERKR